MLFIFNRTEEPYGRAKKFAIVLKTEQWFMMYLNLKTMNQSVLLFVKVRIFCTAWYNVESFPESNRDLRC